MIIFIFFYIPIIIKAWIPTPHLCRVGFLIVLATLISSFIRKCCYVMRVNNRSFPTSYGYIYFVNGRGPSAYRLWIMTERLFTDLVFIFLLMMIKAPIVALQPLRLLLISRY